MRKSFVTTLKISIFTCIIFSSCQPNTNCPDCKDGFASEFKIKKIESFQGVTLKASAEFFYAGNLIDSIYQKLYFGADSNRIKYKLVYNHCVLSGYYVSIIDTINRNFKRDVGFIIDSNKIQQKIEAQYELIPFDENSLFGKYEYVNAADSTIPERLRRCFPGCLQIGRRNFNHYNSAVNVDTVRAQTDEPIFTSSQVFDTKINPLHRQNGVLYYLSLKPFVYGIPPASLGFDDLFDFVELSRNNPTIVTKRTPFAADHQYTFTYTYNGSNLPTLIQIGVASPISPVLFGPPVAVGEIHVEYY